MGKIILSVKEQEVLKEYAENDMNELKTARNAYMSRGTVYYHLNHIKERTGYNPRRFYDLVKLLKLIESTEYKEAV